MKKIEEEWKTVEEFPDYEISNFGRCRSHKRRYKNGKILKVSLRSKDNKCFYGYSFPYPKIKGVRQKEKHISVGILVARSFIENPNGYKSITYIDRDTSNAMFTNIKWTKYMSENDPHEYGAGVKKIKKNKEEQLKKLREKIEMAERFENALLNGTEQEFIYGEIKEMCQKRVRHRYRERSEYFKEEMVSFIIDAISDRVSRGYALVSYEYTIDVEIIRFYRQYKEQIKTVEFDERRM